jgi:hypothetical protein
MEIPRHYIQTNMLEKVCDNMGVRRSSHRGEGRDICICLCIIILQTKARVYNQRSQVWDLYTASHVELRGGYILNAYTYS